jgi:DNA modification methylase
MKTRNKIKDAPELANSMSMLEHKLGPIEYRPCTSLRVYQNNPRQHSQKQLVKLAASIREFGFAMPILVDEDGTIIAGEARLAAARHLGLTDVPVLVACHWSPAQVKAYRLADNRLSELGKWDNKLLAAELDSIMEVGEVEIEILGWEMGEIDALQEQVVAGDGADDPADVVPELSSTYASRSGDLWLLGKHRLLCGSSLETACRDELMDGKTAAMLFTDAPYNVPVGGHVCGLGAVQHAEFAMASGEMNKGQFTDFLESAVGAAARHLKDGAVAVLAMDWRHCSEMLGALERVGLSLLNLCVWSKTNGGMGSLYRSKHELFWIAKMGRAPHTNNVELGKNGRYRTNVWAYPGVNAFGRGRMDDLTAHPTVKPTALVADAIRDVTKANEIVIDGFMGSGTTILAAERTGRIAFGIEIEPAYVDVAIRRWQAMSGRDAVLAATGETFEQVLQNRAAD